MPLSRPDVPRHQGGARLRPRSPEERPLSVLLTVRSQTIENVFLLEVMVVFALPYYSVCNKECVSNRKAIGVE